MREFLGGGIDVEQAFFAGVRLRNGVYKTTTEHRMDDLLPALIENARAIPGPVRVLDIGCSSGVSTVEMHQALTAAGVEAETTGTDLALEADYVTRHDGCAMLFDSSEKLLQVEIGDWASPWSWRPRDRVLRPLRTRNARQLVLREIESFRRAAKVPTPGFESRRVRLLARKARDVSGVRFLEEDLLAPSDDRTFHVIRVANLLNPSYFTTDQLRRMISAIRVRLADGGLLLVVRSDGDPPLNRATIFRRSGAALAPIWTLNGGSEIADLVSS